MTSSSASTQLWRSRRLRGPRPNSDQRHRPPAPPAEQALTSAQQKLTDQSKQLEESSRPTLSGLGTRVEQILRLAEEQANEHRGEAKRESEGIVSAARLEAREITDKARAEAAAMKAGRAGGGQPAHRGRARGGRGPGAGPARGGHAALRRRPRDQAAAHCHRARGGRAQINGRARGRHPAGHRRARDHPAAGQGRPRGGGEAGRGDQAAAEAKDKPRQGAAGALAGAGRAAREGRA